MSSRPRTADQSSDSNGAGPAAVLHFRGLLEEVEAAFAQAMEKAVGGASFGELIGYAAENITALNRIASDSADLAVANLRLAGRRDIVRLQRQLGRTEDKLERLLQEVEGLRDELANGNRRA